MATLSFDMKSLKWERCIMMGCTSIMGDDDDDDDGGDEDDDHNGCTSTFTSQANPMNLLPLDFSNFVCYDLIFECLSGFETSPCLLDKDSSIYGSITN